MAGNGYGSLDSLAAAQQLDKIEAGLDQSKQAYGMAQNDMKSYAPILKKKVTQRYRMTPGGTCMNLFFPWILFVLVTADMTFGIHYYHTLWCWIIAIVGLLAALAIGGLAAQKAGQLLDGSAHPYAIWLNFLFLTSLIAAVSGIWIGEVNYWENMHPYYDIQSLNEYIAVDPSKNHGKQMMDAGLVRFVDNVTLDRNFAYKFEDFDQYCVAPISMKSAVETDSKLDYYDFWVVGLNCCPSNLTRYTDFRCGAFNSSTARQGLRLMEENQRNFYELAVQQATAAHKIKSTFPIFFYWAEDAHDEWKSYYDYGFRYFILAICCAFATQLLLFLWTSFFVAGTT
jgi:hypothetical protein